MFNQTLRMPIECRQESKKYVLCEQTPFVQKCCSGYMQCEVDNSAKTVSPRNRLFLAQCQSSKWFDFIQNFVLEMFSWTRGMPIWGTWSFLASQNFLAKTIKWYNVVSTSRKTFSKCSSGHEDSGLDTLVEYFCQKSKTSSLKIGKQFQIYNFFSNKKSFVPECFSGHMECEVDNTAKSVSPRNRLFLAHCPKFELFWFQPKIFPRNVPLDTWNAYLRNLEFSCK